MNESNNKEKQPVRFWPYACWGSFILVLFVTAITAPDYFNYQIRLAKVESTAKIAQNVVVALSASNSKITADSTVLKSAGETVTKSFMSPVLEPKSSEIFDTYGKLITMLLGFISVLGVFFGYFVRKSLREAEEDLRDHVKLSMDLWEKEKDRLSAEVSNKLKEIAKDQGQQKTKADEFDTIIAKSKKALEALEAAAKTEEQKLTGATARTATAAAMIDADDSIPEH